MFDGGGGFGGGEKQGGLKENMKNCTWRRYKEFKKKIKLESEAKCQRLKLLLKGK